MHNVYILLTDTGSLFTRVIKQVTRNPYNHVSISFEEDLHILYSFGRRQPNNPFFGGFVEESIYSGTFKRFENTTCMVLKFTVEDDEYNLLKSNVKKFVSNMDGYNYNLIGLIGAAFNIKVPRRNSYFCSEFVAELMYRSNLNYWDRPSHLIRPFDFGESDKFEIIYEGLLTDYASKYTEMRTT